MVDLAALPIGDHPREAVVLGEVDRLVVGDLARLGAGDGKGDRGGACPARRPRGDRRRAHGRVPPGQRALVAHAPHGLPEPPPVERVDVVPQVVRQRGPDPALPPGAEPVREQRELGRGVRGVGGRVAVGARVLRDDGAVAVHHRDPRRPEPDDHLPAGALGRRRVPVPAVDAHLALLVGARPPVLHALERARGERQHRREVVLEQPGLRPPLPVVLLARHVARPPRQPLVVPVDVPHPRDRYEEVPPLRPDLVLHGALLVAGVGVAEPVLEPVVGAAGLEEPGGADPVAHAAPDPGRVVEDDPGWDAADELEDVPGALAHALRVLAGEHLGEPHVGVWEARDEVGHLAPRAPRDERRVAEVDLRDPRGPVEVEEAVRGAPEAEPRLPHVAPDGLLGHVGAALVDEPAPDPVRRVPLLPVLPGVVREPLVHERRPPVHLRGFPLPRLGGLRREVLHPRVLVDRVARHAQLAGDGRHGLAPAVLPSHGIDSVHAGHSFWASLVATVARQSLPLAGWSACP